MTILRQGRCWPDPRVDPGPPLVPSTNSAPTAPPEGINPAGPVYPPGAYAVSAAMPYGTYGAIIDYGTGQFSNGIAGNPCTYATYDAAGNIINTGTFNSNLQAPPQAEIDRSTTLFRTSGCTPWALTKPH